MWCNYAQMSEVTMKKMGIYMAEIIKANIISLWGLQSDLGIQLRAEDGDCETVRTMKQSR